jgi:hypothetical protein
MAVDTRFVQMALTVRLALVVVVAGLFIPGAVPTRAQTLADVAREEEARRKEIRRPSKVYTNKDLASVPRLAEPSPATPNQADVAKDKPAAKDEKAVADGAGAVKDAANGAAKEKPKDQAYWSARMKELELQLDRDKVLNDAMQSRINALTADFSARDDPFQRAKIGADRQRALEELERLRKAIANDQKAIADLQEEARRASVPPGWLR